MAAIPTYLYLGDEVITGGQIGVKPTTGLAFSLTGSLVGLGTMLMEYQKVVPSNAGGVTGGTFYPYFDGTYVKSYTASAGGADTISVATATFKVDHLIGKTVQVTAGTGSGQSKTVTANTTTTITTDTDWGTPPDATSVFNLGPGHFVPFHYISDPAITLVPGAKGDNWFELTQSITPCGMLMQRLGTLYANTAPGFRFLKYAQVSGVDGWSTGQSEFSNMLVHLNEMKGITEGLGDTIDVRAIILDCFTSDIFNTNLGFQADLDNAIDSFRADVSATALIVLVLPHELCARTQNGGVMAPAVRAAIRSTVVARQAAGDANVKLYDMNWGSFTWNAGGSNTVLPDNPRYYDLPTVIQTGIGLYNVIAAHFAPAVTAPSGRALASVVLLSDSQWVGIGKNPLMALYADQPTMVGATTGDTVKEDVWIWDDAVQQLVFYDVMSNSNTFGASGWMGPDVTLPRKLLRRYPQGVVIFKFAQAGLGMTPEAVVGGATGHLEAGTLLDEIKTAYTQCRVSCLQTTNRNMDTIGVCVALGDNDCNAGEDATAAFEARSGQWVDDVREIFTTRVDGLLPFVWMLPPPPATEVTGGSVLGLATFRNRVRVQIVALETEKENFKYVRNDGPDDWELSRDQVHYGGETLWRIGDQLALDLIEIITSDDTLGGADEGGTDDEGATDGGTDDEATDDTTDETTEAEAVSIMDALDSTIRDGGGILSHTVNGQTTTYNGLDAMIRARKYFEGLQSRANGLRRTRVGFRR